MDGLFFLIGIACILALLSGPVAFVMLLRMRKRLASLEQQLHAQGGTEPASPSAAQSVAPGPARQVQAETSGAGEEADAEPQETVGPPPMPSAAGAEGATQDSVPPPLPSEEKSNATQGATASTLDTESKVGGKLTIWIGGLALAFGGLFLVRYAIENALLGPGARVALGFAFGAIVALGGEWLRRRQQAFTVPGFDKANIPATLTAVGIFSMFAAIYAAHALYGLIGPTPAFLALALLALAGLALSLVHGPGLAAIGLLASYAAPFLIDAQTDSITVIAIYVLAVSAAALSVARLRTWLWLALSVVAAMTLFGFAFTLGAGRDQVLVTDLYLLGAFALGLAIFVLSFGRQQPDREAFPRPDWIATGALSILILPVVPSFVWSKAQSLELVELALLFGVPLAIVYRYPALRFVLGVPFLAGCLRYLTLGLPAVEVPAELLEGPSLYAAELAGSVQVFAATGFATAVAILAAGFILSMRSPARATIAAAGSAATIGLLLVAYFRIEQFASSAMFALFGLVLAAVCYLLAVRSHANLHDEKPGATGTLASYLIASLVALTFAVAVALEGPAMTVALGLIPAAVAFINARYELTALRVFALLSAIPYALRLLWQPLIDPQALAASPPFFNDLLWGYGLPALGLVWAAWQTSRNKIDVWAEALQALAVAASVVTIALLGLHAIDPTFAFATKSQELAAIATSVLVGGGFSLGLTRISVRSQFRIPRLAADLFSLGGIVIGALGLCLYRNPALDGAPPFGTDVGEGMIFNLITFAHLLPSLVFGAIAVLGRTTKARWVVIAAAIFATTLAFLWVNLSIRQAFSPGFLQANPIEQGELTVYSITWIIIGLVVLGLGIGLRNFLLRAASGVIFVLVTLKVFLVDLSELDGILRPLSFIGLGLVLLAIGFVYQRALSRMQAAAPPETGAAER